LLWFWGVRTPNAIRPAWLGPPHGLDPPSPNLPISRGLVLSVNYVCVYIWFSAKQYQCVCTQESGSIKEDLEELSPTDTVRARERLHKHTHTHCLNITEYIYLCVLFIFADIGTSQHLSLLRCTPQSPPQVGHIASLPKGYIKRYVWPTGVKAFNKMVLMCMANGPPLFHE